MLKRHTNAPQDLRSLHASSLQTHKNDLLAINDLSVRYHAHYTMLSLEDNKNHYNSNVMIQVTEGSQKHIMLRQNIRYNLDHWF